jgi:hypothetical protein
MKHLVFITFITAITCTGFSQKTYKMLGKRKGIKIFEYYNNKTDFDIENYYGLFKYRDSIVEEFIAFSIEYFRNDTLVLGIEEYKPKKERDEVAELYFKSKHLSQFSNLILVFGYSKSAWNEEGKLEREYFKPRWVYIREN